LRFKKVLLLILLEEVDEDTLGLYGMCLDQLGQFCLSQGRLTEAEVAFRQAAAVASKVHGEHGEQTLVVLNSLASVLRYNVDHIIIQFSLQTMPRL
jgi:hypothetical protein